MQRTPPKYKKNNNPLGMLHNKKNIPYMKNGQIAYDFHLTDTKKSKKQEVFQHF